MRFNEKNPALPLGREVRLPLRKRVALLLGLGLSLVLPAQADTEGLRQTLETYARIRLDHYLQSLHWPDGERTLHSWLPDGAAHLPPCRQAVAVRPSNQSGLPWGRQLYQLRCDDPVWELTARVELRLTLPVRVARHDLPAGHRVQAGDLLAKSMEVSHLFREFTPRDEDLVGRRTLRRIRIGQLLGPGQLQAPLLVKRKDLVLLRAAGEGFAATMKGIALEDGGLGDSIKVRNQSSGRTVQGWVVEPGVVETRF